MATAIRLRFPQEAVDALNEAIRTGQSVAIEMTFLITDTDSVPAEPVPPRSTWVDPTDKD